MHSASPVLIFTQQSLYTYYHNNVRFKFALEPKLLQATPTPAFSLAHLPGLAGWVALSSASRGSRDARLKSNPSTSLAVQRQTNGFPKGEGLAGSWDNMRLLPPSKLLGCLPLSQPQCRMESHAAFPRRIGHRNGGCFCLCHQVQGDLRSEK